MFAELTEWVLNLDPEFAFLLALPFAVALAGWLSEVVNKSHAVREGSETARGTRTQHHTTHTHVWSR